MTEDLKKRIQHLGYELAARDRQASQAIAAQKLSIDVKLDEILTDIAKLQAAQQQGIDVKLDEILTAIAKLHAAIAKLQSAAENAVGAKP